MPAMPVFDAEIALQAPFLRRLQAAGCSHDLVCR